MDINVVGMGREEVTRTAKSPLGTLKANELGILRTPIFSCYNNQISLRCTLGHIDHPLEVCDR